MSEGGTTKRVKAEKDSRDEASGGSAKKASKTPKLQKQGWSHILDKINHSSGLGDNIYVFG